MDLTIENLQSEEWRLNNLYLIKNKDGEVQHFTMNQTQRFLYNNLWYLSIVLKARQLGCCLDPATRVLTADLRWVPIGELRIGDEVVAVDEYPLKKGRGATRKMRTAQVEGVVAMQAEKYRITFADGREVVCTDWHPWLTRTGLGCEWLSIKTKGGRKRKKLKPGSCIRSVTRPWGEADYEDGWFSGMLDGEGSMAKPSCTGASVNVSQVVGPVWYRILQYLESRGYTYRIEDDKDRPSKFGKRPVPKAVISRMDEVFRLFGQTRPSRFLPRRFWEGKELPGKGWPDTCNPSWAEIVKIEPEGKGTVIDLQTSEGTYIAEGLVSHNTTFFQLFILDRCLFNDNTNAGVIAHTQVDAQAFFDDKLLFAYENLPEEIRRANPADTKNVRELKFANGSRLRVGTSMRSGTLQYLHISEFGKICAKYPDKAREIITGSLNTVSPGNFVAIESTAEGPMGAFYDMCLKAETLHETGQKLTHMDYKFFFFPWFDDPAYRLETFDGAPLPPEYDEYFRTLESENDIQLTIEQKRWYVAKAEEQGEEMRREYPSTPAEAFEAKIKGAVFGKQMQDLHHTGRALDLPVESGIPVNTFWDLGRNDINAIWFHQRVGPWDHFIDYYEHRQVDITHYIEKMDELAKKRGYRWGTVYLPHDGKTKHIESIAGSAKDILQANGFTVKVTGRPTVKNVSIASTRRQFPHCKFDKTRCAVGLKHLMNYQWSWDETHKTYRNTPLHNVASNGADAFQTYGHGYKGEKQQYLQQLDPLDRSRVRTYGSVRRKAHKAPNYDHIV